MKPHTGETRQQRRARERLEQKKLKPQPASQLWIWCKKIPNRAYAAIAATAVFVGLLVLYPWLSIEQGQRLRPVDPFGIILNVSNEGYFSLRDISVVCNFDLVDGNGSVFNNASAIYDHFAESLSFKHKLSLPCFRAARIQVPIEKVSLRVLLSYNIWHFPGRRRQSFSLTGAVDANRNWQWLFNN